MLLSAARELFERCYVLPLPASTQNLPARFMTRDPGGLHGELDGAEAGGGPGEDFEGPIERATEEGFELFGGGEGAPGSPSTGRLGRQALGSAFRGGLPSPEHEAGAGRRGKVRFLARVRVVALPDGQLLRSNFVAPRPDEYGRSRPTERESGECRMNANGSASCREETGIAIKRRRRTEVHEDRSASPTSAKADIDAERAEGCAR
jgi:hypothetical protein